MMIVSLHLQFLGREKDNSVRRSVVSGKKVCLILCSGDFDV